MVGWALVCCLVLPPSLQKALLVPLWNRHLLRYHLDLMQIPYMDYLPSSPLLLHLLSNLLKPVYDLTQIIHLAQIIP